MIFWRIRDTRRAAGRVRRDPRPATWDRRVDRLLAMLIRWIN